MDRYLFSNKLVFLSLLPLPFSTLHAENATSVQHFGHVIDFESATLGDIIDDEFSDLGVKISAANYGEGPSLAVVFDTSDDKTNSPFYSGDYSVNTSQQSLVIPRTGYCSETRCYYPTSASDAPAGTVQFEFDEPVIFRSLDIFNDFTGDEALNSVHFYDENDELLASFNIPKTDKTEWLTLPFNVSNVKRMEVELYGSSAIDNVDFLTQAFATGCHPEFKSKPHADDFSESGFSYEFSAKGCGDVEYRILEAPEGTSVIDQRIIWVPPEDAASNIIWVPPEDAASNIIWVPPEDAASNIIWVPPEDASSRIIWVPPEDAASNIIWVPPEDASSRIIWVPPEDAVSRIIWVPPEDASSRIIWVPPEDAVSRIIWVPPEDASSRIIWVPPENVASFEQPENAVKYLEKVVVIEAKSAEGLTTIQSIPFYIRDSEN